MAPNDAAVLTDIGFANWFLGRFSRSVPVLARAASPNSNAAMTCALLGNARSIDPMAAAIIAFRKVSPAVNIIDG